MARYIDANELQKAFEKIADEPDYMHEGDTWETGIYLAGAITDKQPTADVVEVKHGEWKLTKTEFGWNGCEYPAEYTCSVCGRVEAREEPYCHCGAKMDGGVQE